MAMILTKENYLENINSFSELNWKPLIELIPEIEKTKKFGEFSGDIIKENDTITIPFSIHGEIVSQFLDIVYKMPIIIDFHWSDWDEGRTMASDENFDFDTIDIPTKCKLITALVRNDRFCDGVLIEAFESGLILRILISIRNQITSNSNIY